jgi:cell division protease FtsH
MAQALMKYETIDAEQIEDIMNGREPRPPEGWSDADHGGTPAQPVRAAAPAAVGDAKIGGPASQH